MKYIVTLEIHTPHKYPEDIESLRELFPYGIIVLAKPMQDEPMEDEPSIQDELHVLSEL